MPRQYQKHKIIKKFAEGIINNHIALELKLSREYVRQVRAQFQSKKCQILLSRCSTEKLRFSPPDYIHYKWLIDARVVKAVHIDFMKNTTLTLTPLGIDFLKYLNTLPETKFFDSIGSEGISQ